MIKFAKLLDISNLFYKLAALKLDKRYEPTFGDVGYIGSFVMAIEPTTDINASVEINKGDIFVVDKVTPNIFQLRPVDFEPKPKINSYRHLILEPLPEPIDSEPKPVELGPPIFCDYKNFKRIADISWFRLNSQDKLPANLKEILKRESEKEKFF